MAARVFLNYLYATLTESAADVFVQATIATPVAGTGFAGVVREIVVAWPRPNIVAAANAEIALTRKTLTAMPDIDEKSLIFKRKRYIELGTQGAFFDPDGVQVLQYTDEQAPVIVEPNWYCQFDSAASGIALVAKIRIGYTLEKISEVDRLSIIATSLQS